MYTLSTEKASLQNHCSNKHPMRFCVHADISCSKEGVFSTLGRSFAQRAICLQSPFSKVFKQVL